MNIADKELLERLNKNQIHNLYVCIEELEKHIAENHIEIRAVSQNIKNWVDLNLKNIFESLEKLKEETPEFDDVNQAIDDQLKPILEKINDIEKQILSMVDTKNLLNWAVKADARLEKLEKRITDNEIDIALFCNVEQNIKNLFESLEKLEFAHNFDNYQAVIKRIEKLEGYFDQNTFDENFKNINLLNNLHNKANNYD